MTPPVHPALAQIRLLDELLLTAVTGQEIQVADWMEQRRRAIQHSLEQRPSLADLEELQDRTRRIEDRFLHWRRSSMMELSLIEQHLRYLHEQQPDKASVRINVSA
jgi:hypothetical protein